MKKPKKALNLMQLHDKRFICFIVDAVIAALFIIILDALLFGWDLVIMPVGLSFIFWNDIRIVRKYRGDLFTKQFETDKERLQQIITKALYYMFYIFGIVLLGFAVVNLIRILLP